MKEHLFLPPQHWATLCRLLQLYLPHAEVWAFGSRVKGTHWDASDIDLVVRCPASPQQATDLAALKQALSDSPIPYVVQIHDWAKLPSQFQAEMSAAHRVIQTPQQY
ncbi:nucleotidyltransferase family protein [Deefgea piscis]|uniref:nucleotidyltransferase family protein n=1 Tax=Deefgea piscis TaxID=2739061 RepID=UPI001C81820D|nr:nucleotidyltransferase domain-containing protein [Deefgea piscis]QZA81539.1 nucleotidyltransferase domain-containing protein [Deefgea piscis]